MTDNPSKYKSEDEFCSIICLDILSGKQPWETGNLAKIEKPVPLMWKLRQIWRRIICLRRIIRLLAPLEDVLSDESASDEFCSIIRLSTDFILETGYPSETDNSFLV